MKHRARSISYFELTDLPDPTRMTFLLAAGSAPPFFTEVAVILVATAALAYLGNRLRIMPIVSFLIAGALIGPNALGLVQDESLIEAAAEIGVVLLLFTIGIEFSLDKLARIQRLIFVGGGVQVVLTIALVTGLLALAGVHWRHGVFTGCLVALSSTVIVMKLLMNRREANTAHGQASLGVLIFQDLAIVAMVLLVPMLGGEGGSAGRILLAVGKAIGIVILVLVVARRIMPKVLEAVARTCSQEIFVLSVVAICLGTAFLTSLAGVSLSLGAFLAGLVVSESRYSQMAFGEVLPLQILFSATFFVSVGLLLDIGFLLESPLLILAMIAAVLFVKFIATAASLKVLGYSTGLSAATGLLLAQVGEFSFVLERAGREAGLFAAGLADSGPPAFIAVTVVLMLATPVLGHFTRRLDPRHAAPPHEETRGDASHEPVHSPMTDHVVIAGYGAGARALAPALQESGVPFVVVTFSPEGARHAEEQGYRVLRGNYVRQHELGLVGVRSARLLVVLDDDVPTTRRVIDAVRAMSIDLPILARTKSAAEGLALANAGAEVVAAETEGTARVVRRVLETLGAPESDLVRHETEVRVNGMRELANAVESIGDGARAQTVRLSFDQQNSMTCRHVGQTRDVVPSSSGCQECIALQDTWVHLRVCMTCGHVGCCNSSKNKHAQRHAVDHGHPVVKSFEPGEDWAWCYVDATYL